MVDLRNGDCLEVLKKMEGNSVDLILTDPPYELGFMGKKWDSTGIAYSIDLWKEALRVLKPGGYLMAFSSARTYHRMACAIDDAGFEVREMLEWIYGSGFPKALDISKALDKKLGVEREVIGKSKAGLTKGSISNFSGTVEFDVTAPASDIAKQYKGYKTTLKPAHEPVVLAMKPLEGSFAENILKYGTGGLNIDGTRIPTEDNLSKALSETKSTFSSSKLNGSVNDDWKKGRFPANLIISEDIAPVLDNQASVGGASRFFYNAKIENEDYIPFYYSSKCSPKEKNSDINGNKIDRVATKVEDSAPFVRANNMQTMNVNNHPTVKPKSIMKYLAKLGIPPYDAVILDMFAGSGSTALAIEELNKETGRNHKTILIEREKDYCEIIKKRLNL